MELRFCTHGGPTKIFWSLYPLVNWHALRWTPQGPVFQMGRVRRKGWPFLWNELLVKHDPKFNYYLGFILLKWFSQPRYTNLNLWLPFEWNQASFYKACSNKNLAQINAFHLFIYCFYLDFEREPNLYECWSWIPFGSIPKRLLDMDDDVSSNNSQEILPDSC